MRLDTMPSTPPMPLRAAAMDLEGYECFDLSDDAQAGALTSRFGLHPASVGKRNRVYVHPAVRSLAGVLNFGGEDNEIVFGEGCSFHGEIVSMDHRARTILRGGQHTLNLQAFVYRDATLDIGRGTVSYGLRVWVSEERSLSIGERCLFSEGIAVRTTDHHSIFSIETLDVLNPPADVSIGDFVWVNQDVTILKGVTVGNGAILGAKALINRSIPAHELWSGSPARMLRQGIGWAEPNPATPEQMRERLVEMGIAPGA